MADELKGHRLTFAGDTFVIQGAGKTLYKGTFKIVATRPQGHIDFVHTEGDAKGQTWRGIYAVVGDTLRITDNAPDVTSTRPTEFAAPAGSGHVAIIFKRVAP